MIITISGKPGSGKSTITNKLAKKLKLKKYSVGDFIRELAKKQNKTLLQFNKENESDIKIDKLVDDWQKKIGKTEDNFIINGRLSYYFIHNSIKVFLDVSEEEGSRRIMLDNRKEEIMKDKKQAIKLWKQRMSSDKKRYKKFYNLNPFKKSQYDLIVDTTNLTRSQVVKKVLEFVEK